MRADFDATTSVRFPYAMTQIPFPLVSSPLFFLDPVQLLAGGTHTFRSYNRGKMSLQTQDVELDTLPWRTQIEFGEMGSPTTTITGFGVQTTFRRLSPPSAGALFVQDDTAGGRGTSEPSVSPGGLTESIGESGWDSLSSPVETPSPSPHNYHQTGPTASASSIEFDPAFHSRPSSRRARAPLGTPTTTPTAAAQGAPRPFVSHSTEQLYYSLRWQTKENDRKILIVHRKREDLEARMMEDWMQRFHNDWLNRAPLPR
jgi:hypothetical protein